MKQKKIVIKSSKGRLFFIIFFMLIIFILVSFISPIFTLKNIDVRFYDKSNNYILHTENNLSVSKEFLSQFIIKNKIPIGKSIFTVENNRIINTIEYEYPSLKVLSVEKVFPNKCLFHLRERTPLFYLNNGNERFLLDDEFKILKITHISNQNKIIPIYFFNASNQISFFDFFQISSLAFSEGDFLYNNNLLFETLMPLVNNTHKILVGNVLQLDIKNNKESTIDVLLHTSHNNFGVVLKIEDIMKNSKYKYRKIQNAFISLYEKEKIKLTYGTLIIDKKNNCFWNKM